MDWVLSNAHLELLICDQPIISYKKRKEGANHTKKEMNDVMAKWEAKRKKMGKDADFSVGAKLDLNEFLRTGMDALKNTKTE